MGPEGDARTDEILMDAFRTGDGAAFEILVRRHSRGVYNYLLRSVHNTARAEEMLQEVFMRVIRSKDRYQQSAKFTTWVYTIASNLAKNELRNRSRSPLVLFQKLTTHWEPDHRPLQFEDGLARPDDQYRKRYLQQIVEQTVEELPEHHKLVFRLRELEGKSYEEIAEITGVNLGTVKSRLHRARTSFAELIEPLLN